ncbi:photoreceptor cilium actin regulator [Antennarius striatus]|uniref:photoreceptor cilium actin regulator n=1 Tax=Antennarius striatus TaxID=241820 RepID=UPI0035B4F5F8
MGCSPSKANNFGTLGPMRKGRMLPSTPLESLRDSKIENGENHNSTRPTDGNAKERTLGQTQAIQKEAHMTPQKKKSVTDAPSVNMDKIGSQGMGDVTFSQRKEKHIVKQGTTEKKSGRKPKKNTKGLKVLKKKDKDKEKTPTEGKVDFPEPLVKAHQAAYAFLNPSINKYDTLLGHLEQATQTQVSVQPMVCFMALRYDEIIQELEEMVEEGEKVLKDNGEHLAWPRQMTNLSSSTRKCDSANFECPPDLLQQLLQYTTQRMRNVSKTVGGIGDSALEEAVEYFASVSELIEQKLKVKRALEMRLMQLLSRIEIASLRKLGPEDSALFSEDSGIGAENESLAGSERCHRRESCESVGTNRITPVSPMEYNCMNVGHGVSKQRLARKISPSVSLSSLNSTCSTNTMLAYDQRDSVLGSVSLDDGEDEDNDYEEEIDRGAGVRQQGFIKQSNSLPINSVQFPRRLPPNHIENPQNVEMTLKMKNAISGRIQFVPSQTSNAKTKGVGSPKNRHQWNDDEEQCSKRPQTAACIRNPGVKKIQGAMKQRSRSAESLRSRGEDPTLLELNRTQKELNQRVHRMNKNKANGNIRTTLSKQNQESSQPQSPAIVRKQKNSIHPQPMKGRICIANQSTKKQAATTTNVEEGKSNDKNTSQGPIKPQPLIPTPPSSPRPSSGFYRGRNSVKKLIDTFSQGIVEQDNPEALGPLKGVRKCGVPVLPGLGNVEAVLSSGLTSCRPESDYFDLDSLPPPPLEVLMDNSFDNTNSVSTGVTDEGATKVRKSPLLKRAVVSQRLRASVHSVTVLPSKKGLPQSSKVLPLARADQKDISKVTPSDVQLPVNPAEEKEPLKQQARKFIHLQQPADSERSSQSDVEPNVSTVHGDLADVQDCMNLSLPGTIKANVNVPPSSVLSNQPPATPPMARGRMLPSTPPIPNNLQRRLPTSPHNFKRQPSPTSSTCTRNLPTPPSVQKRLPSPPAAKENIMNSNSSSTYPFKTPTPPASPKLQRVSRENSSEDSISSRVFKNARSVFCPASPSLFEAQPCPVPRPPEAWTSTGVSILSRVWRNRGRVPVSFQGPRPFIRRSQSDRRPSLSLLPRSPGISVAETCGSEPAINSQGLDDESTGEEELWTSQSDLRATLRSASHPDLCVVGQALHRDLMGQ